MITASTRATAPKLTLSDLKTFDARAALGGAERVCRCPICQSDERAFHFNAETGVYNCKRASCLATGKLADFWTERPKPSASTRARSALNAAFSLAPINGAATPQNATKRETAAPATAATWETHFAHSIPAASTRAAHYLASRGISETICEAADVRALMLQNRACVLFPFRDQGGAAVAFQARAIDARPDAHRAYGRKSAGVFLSAPDALRGETVIICEAPIDALSLAACGFAAVALGGVIAPEWIAAALAFKRALLAFDNDANGAGDQAAAALAPDLQSFGAKVARLSPQRAPDLAKSDFNAMLQKHGAATLRAWLRARIAHIGYFQFGNCEYSQRARVLPAHALRRASGDG
jgi:hypothetical protein